MVWCIAKASQSYTFLGITQSPKMFKIWNKLFVQIMLMQVLIFYLSVISSHEVNHNVSLIFSPPQSNLLHHQEIPKKAHRICLFFVFSAVFEVTYRIFFGWVGSMVAVCFLVGKVIFLVGGPQKGNNWCNHMHSKKSLYVSMSTVFSKEMTYFQTLIILLLYVTYIVGCEIE